MKEACPAITEHLR